MFRSLSSRALAGLFLVVATAPRVAATTVTIQPSSQDAYVQQDRPNRTAGSGLTNTRIRVMTSTPNPRVRRGLVQFDLSAVPQFSTINSAVVSLFEANNPGVAHVQGLQRVNDPWLQSSVKWNTQPTAQAVPTGTMAVGTSRGFRSVTVTSDVQGWINNPTSNHGWLVKDAAENVGNEEIAYISKEEDHVPDLANRPILVVDFTAPPCTTNADCADSSLCTTNERCVAGHCAVDSVNCDDSNDCTDDICDPDQGCLNPVGECNDGFDCTIDSCNPIGGCVNTPVDSTCTNGGCRVSTCVADPDNPNVEPASGCVTTSVDADGSACDSDGLECTGDSCLSGSCTHPNLSPGTGCSVDGNPCTDDVCDGAGACHVNNSATCEDGDFCTVGDQCAGGGCVSGPAVVCTALGECYDVGTCNPGTGMCSNPPKPNGSSCTVDGNPCTDDVCDGAGVCGVNNSATCNDGDACTQTDQCSGGGCVGSNPVICPAPDQCHTPGTCDTGSGICSNPAKPNGTGCSDGNTCTLADQCLAGSCQGNPTTCGDNIVQPSCGEQCDDSSPGANCNAQCQFICGPTPQSGCRKPIAPKKAAVTLKDKSPDKKDSLTWKWLKGVATSLADFGAPQTTTSYALCVYDGTGNPQPRILAMIPAGGTCGTKPCWSMTKKGGLKYKNKDATPDGITNVLLIPAGDGAAKAIVKGKGVNLGMFTLPATTPVTVQLKRIDNAGICWDASFSTPIKNLPDKFTAKGD